MPKLLDFQCALVVDGGEGVGKAIARHFVSQDKKILIAGRMGPKLQSATKEIGAHGYYFVDMQDAVDVAALVRNIVIDHPDLDCVINDASAQRPFHVLSWLDSTENSIARAESDIAANIRGPMRLTLELVPHLRTKRSPMIMNIFSNLGFVPFAFANPVYNATKAWLHFWSTSLRAQLQREASPIRVVEVGPPEFCSHWHHYTKTAPADGQATASSYLSIEDFLSELAGKLDANEEVISAGLDFWT